MKPTVLIYADPLLSPTMTFVRAQGEALNGFTPYYVGPRRLRVAGLDLPADRTMAINGMSGVFGKLREAPYRRFGFAPIYLRNVQKLHPVLLHAHSATAGLSALHMAEWLRIPQVTTFHGFDATAKNPAEADPRYGNRDYVRRKHVLTQKSKLFVAVSRFIRDRILEQGFPEEKVVVHYTGVDTEFFHPDRALKRGPTILFVGSLTEQKGCEFLIRAVAKASAVACDLELVVIGEGPERGRLERLARENVKRFRFLGVQPPAVVRDWMGLARVFSVPSVRVKSGAEEGFGMVFAEAQAMECPVASFASGGIPEIVVHKETGLLANERDVEALSQHILLLMRDDTLWNRMSEAGRERVCSLFDLKVQTKRLEDLYVRVLHNESSARDFVTRKPMGERLG